MKWLGSYVYVMKDGEVVTIDLGQHCKYILLSIPHVRTVSDNPI